jgi:gamma-glutamyltranspeptidase / glutathione hydrolase
MPSNKSRVMQQLKSVGAGLRPNRLPACLIGSFSCSFVKSFSLSLLGVLLVFLPGSLSPQSQQQSRQPREFQTPATPANSAWPPAPIRSVRGMVVSDEPLASDAGVEILKKGGNAVDAAVAVGFVLAVVEPEAGNSGGGGFMLVRFQDGRAKFIDYREAAPARASRLMYRKPDGSDDPEGSLVGYRSVAVPGTVAGLALALKEFGTMKLPAVMAPAIHLAENGFPVGDRLAALFHESASVLDRFPMSRRIFLNGGSFYKPGDILKQPELAATLRRIANDGPAEFYRGKTARDLAEEMQGSGGLLTLDDLAHYAPKIRDPLTANYSSGGHDWEVITSPPPSSGGVAAIEMLNILAPVALKSWDDPESVHWVIEAMRRAFADRAAYLADSDFAKIPVRGLTSNCYADTLRRTIDPAAASSSQKIRAGNPDPFESLSPSAPCPTQAPAALLSSRSILEAQQRALAEAARGGHTTHYSVVDAAGNAVANTYTLNDNFGSGVTSADGFLLNDEMDDFTAHPGVPNMFGLIQSPANEIAPGKRPLSSMMPTILLRDGQLSFVTGSPGGPRIISATFLSIVNWMRLGMDAQSAINAPRFHQQWLPDAVGLEPDFPDAVAKDLEKRGYQIFPSRFWIGEVEAIGIDAKTGERLGAPDPRRHGTASGY